MINKDTTTRVLILNCKIGALAIMRSLGNRGVRLAGVDEDVHAPGLRSRYCQERYVMSYDEQHEGIYLDALLRMGKRFGERAILIPTSDELSLFVAKYADALGEYFLFPRNEPSLVASLVSKAGMYALARKHGVPTPYTVFPRSVDDVREYSKDVKFPVMLKGIQGNRLEARSGLKMAIVRSVSELLETYKRVEDPELPNLMIQEYIPGNDDQIYIFNGYFNERSECLAAFTGRKIRQFPVHTGCASLGECTWNGTVSDLTTNFMRAIGYRGILDIGYRYDQRDGLYKVLDINPRVGQAFRLFLDENGMDVVKCLYLDLTGQTPLPAIVPREGRRWIIEDWDLVSSFHYHREGTLPLNDWFRSLKGIEEGAWFSWKDPVPFLDMAGRFTGKLGAFLLKKTGLGHLPGKSAVIPGPGTRAGA